MGSLLLAFTPLGLAQDTSNAHGLAPVPGGGAPGTLVATWQPERLEVGSWTASATYEYAEWSLIRWLGNTKNAQSTDSLEPPVDYLNTMHLGGRYAVHERVGLGATMPVWVVPVLPDGSTTPGIGDIRMSVPVGVVMPELSAAWWGFSVVPHLQIPSGDAAVDLGAPGLRSGGALALATGDTDWSLTTNLGISTGLGESAGSRGGGSLGGTMALNENIGLGLEILASVPMSDDSGELSSEALVSCGGFVGPQASWTLGAARVLTGGTYTPLHRVFAGLSFTGPPPEPVPVAPPPPVVANGTLRVITRTVNGEAVAAKVHFVGEGDMEPEDLGSDGRGEFSLAPGTWRIVITAASLGRTVQEITLEPGKSDVYIIEIILQPSKVEVKENEIEIKEKIHFAHDKATVESSSMGLLREVAATLLAEEWITQVEVQGHSDSSGEPDYNLDLSQRRVEAVRKVLTGLGVQPDRLVAKGYGESKPIAPNDTDDGRASNRRVQFIIIKKAE